MRWSCWKAWRQVAILESRRPRAAARLARSRTSALTAAADQAKGQTVGGRGGRRLKRSREWQSSRRSTQYLKRQSGGAHTSPALVETRRRKRWLQRRANQRAKPGSHRLSSLQIECQTCPPTASCSGSWGKGPCLPGAGCNKYPIAASDTPPFGFASKKASVWTGN